MPTIFAAKMPKIQAISNLLFILPVFEIILSGRSKDRI
jgi:hypothetical protein